MAKHLGEVLLTYEALAAMASLDTEHRVVAVVPQTASDVAGQRVGFIVEGPSLPLTPEGAAPAVVSFSDLLTTKD